MVRVTFSSAFQPDWKLVKVVALMCMTTFPLTVCVSSKTLATTVVLSSGRMVDVGTSVGAFGPLCGLFQFRAMTPMKPRKRSGRTQLRMRTVRCMCDGREA